MKPLKTICIGLGMLCAVVGTHAQESTFNQDDIVLQAGLGFGTSLYRGASYTTTMPLVSIAGEYGIIEDFITEGMTLGLGAYLGFGSAEFRSRLGVDNWGWRNNYTLIGGRAAVHYPFLENLDTYGGLMLSYYGVSSRSIGNVPPSSEKIGGGLGLSIYFGGRYYFNEQFAGLLELGFGVSFINLGVSVKL